MKRGRVKTQAQSIIVPMEKYGGEVRDVVTLSAIPSYTPLYEGRSVEEVVTYYFNAYKVHPSVVYAFHRTMGYMYYVVMEGMANDHTN